MNSSTDFFKTQRKHSEIKTEIVTKYFKAWASILLIGQSKRQINNLLYIDLYAGQGYYDDDRPSTPILILKSIVENQIFNKKIKTFFNDNETRIINKLEQNIQSLDYYDILIHKPIILNKEANINLLKSLIQQNPNIPSFTFIDPLGYKGISAKLCNLALNEWGSDLFLLFNLNRIRPAILNPNVQHLMNDLFGSEYEYILKRINQLSGIKRELFIIESFENIFRDRGYKTVDFKIKFKNRNQTSHYLLFVSKSDLGYRRMKELMANYSIKSDEGVPYFEYASNASSPELFSKYPIVDLESTLLTKKYKYNGKTIEDIYIIDNIDKPYIKENYKCAFSNLLNKNLIKLLDKKLNETNRITYTARVLFN